MHPQDFDEAGYAVPLGSAEEGPGGVTVNGNESAHGSHRSYTSRRCAMRVILISFVASSIMYTTRQSPTRTRH